MIDLIELYEHWWAGRSQVEISASLGIDRKTIRKYLAPAIEAGLMPGRSRPDGRRSAGRTGGSWPRAGSRRWLTPGCGRSPGRRSSRTGITSSSS